MRITLNLALAPSPRERFALAWAMPTALLAILVLVLLSKVALRDYREYRTVHQSVLEIRGIEAGLREREAALRKQFEQPQLRDLYRQAQFVNALIERKEFSLTELTEKVTKLLPADVRLSGLALAHGGKEPLVRFAVVGNDEEAVEKFLSNLEDSSEFADVAILNQGFAQEGSEAAPVSIACTARYVGGGAR